MPELMVTGKRGLQGRIKISGAKNAVLPQMAASLLTREKITLTNVPNITDVEDMIETLKAYGVTVEWKRTLGILELQAENPASSLPSNNVGKKIRGSFDIFGPLLARTGEAEVYKPGGCSLQTKPRKVNFHIQAMKDMIVPDRAQSLMPTKCITETAESVSMKAKHGLRPATITFEKSSVGATKTVMMAASLVEGTTVIRRAAIEPEIYDLKRMLVKMGATINIEKNVDIANEDIEAFEKKEIIVWKWNVIEVTGRKSLGGVNHRVMPDRIEFATYAIAAAMNNGKIFLEVGENYQESESLEENVKEDMLKAIRKPLHAAGVKIDEESDPCGIIISLENGIIFPVHIETSPYPGFPTDLAPLWLVFMTQAQTSGDQASGSAELEVNHAIIRDTIYNDRFKCADDLKTMGAQIGEVTQNEDGCTCPVHAGSAELNGTRVKAKDLRGGAALVLAGLVAKGTTVVKEFKHIQRGYEDMVKKLNACKAELVILLEARPGLSGGPSVF